jgi:hypothetical protein
MSPSNLLRGGSCDRLPVKHLPGDLQHCPSKVIVNLLESERVRHFDVSSVIGRSGRRGKASPSATRSLLRNSVKWDLMEKGEGSHLNEAKKTCVCVAVSQAAGT